MALKAYLEPNTHESERRTSNRRALRLETSGTLPRGIEANVTIHNISAAGLLIESDSPLGVGEVLSIALPEIGPVGAEVVWESGRLYGCAFEQALGEAVLAAAQLKGMPQIGGNAQSVPTRAPTRDTARTLATGDPLGVKLNRLRRERGLTLEQVATALGVSKPTVWAWEKGKARPILERFAAIAKALGVEQDDLIENGGTGSEAAILDDCRQRLAAAYQVAPSRIRIMIDL